MLQKTARAILHSQDRRQAHPKRIQPARPSRGRTRSTHIFLGGHLAADKDFGGDTSLPVGRQKPIKKESLSNLVSDHRKDALGQLNQLN